MKDAYDSNLDVFAKYKRTLNEYKNKFVEFRKGDFK